MDSDGRFRIDVTVYGGERSFLVTNWWLDDGALFLEDEGDIEHPEKWAFAQGTWQTFHVPRSDAIEAAVDPEDDEEDEVPQFNWGGNDA